MSYSRKQTQTIVKPHCNVCYDAKKPMSVYSTHWVKDKTGKVCCPTLLSQECRFCHKLGHTTKHCSVLKEENAKKEKIEIYKKKSIIQPTQKTQVKENKNINIYAVLCENNDKEEEMKLKKNKKNTNTTTFKIEISSKEHEYPALSTSTSTNKQKSSKKEEPIESYASKLLKEKEVTKMPDEIKINVRTNTYSKMSIVPQQCESPKIPVSMSMPKGYSNYNMYFKKDYICWADMSSSDEGEEDAEENEDEDW